MRVDSVDAETLHPTSEDPSFAPPPESATLPAASPVSVDIFAPPAAHVRPYAIVHPLYELHFEERSTLLGMLESRFAACAPVGSLLIRDSDCGKHGVLCAERIDDGWLLTGDA